MSDARTLPAVPPPRSFTVGGLSLSLGRLDLDGELYFTAEHEAWARNRLEARRGKTSEAAYEADVRVFSEEVSAGRFNFGTGLSLTWLLSPPGQVEYVLLLAQQAGSDATREALKRVQRSDREGWARAFTRLVEEDFPNLLAPAAALSSGATGNPKPGTTESTSS